MQIKCDNSAACFIFCILFDIFYYVYFLIFLCLGAMLATQLNDMVNNGELEPKAIVRLDKFICNTIQETRYIIKLH